MKYRLTRPLLAILVLAGMPLLTAGCAEVGAQPQTASPTAVTDPQVEPSEPLLEQAHEDIRTEPAAVESDNLRASAVQTPPDRGSIRDVDGAATVDEKHAAQGPEAKPVQASPTDSGQLPADWRPEPAERTARVTEGDTSGAAEPNETRARASKDPAPAGPNDPAVEVTEQPTPAPFYRDYAIILKTYLREDGLVDYGTLDRHRLEIKALLMQLDELAPKTYESWSQDAKLALWINAYNLKMLEIVTRNYPIESSWWLRLTWPPSDIRHIEGIWTDYKFIVMDEEFTLAEVERRLFHRTFDDPRVFLAITYASRSSPWLRREPYRPAELDRQLDEQVRQFLANPQGFRIDRRERVVYLSALFKPAWRGKEFVRRYGTDKKFKDRDPATRAVLNFLTGYLSRDDVYFLEVENYRIEYMNFDWRLNDTSRGY